MCDDFLPCHIPQSKSLISRSHNQHLPIRTQLHISSTFNGKVLNEFLLCRVPETDCAVVAAGYQCLSIQTECHRIFTTSMVTQRSTDGFPCCYTPKRRRFFIAA